MKGTYKFIAILLFSIFIISINGVNFSALFLASTAWIIYISGILARVSEAKSNKWLSLLSKVCNILVIIFISSLIIIEGMLVIDINQFKEPKDIEKVDYMIVLGAGLDGYEVGKTLQSRLDRAIEYYNLNKDVNIIASGAQGKDELISEAEAMYNYLIKNGVDKNHIIKEEKATTTQENIIFSKAILKQRNDEDKKVVIVTNEFHLSRAQIIANILDVENEGLASKTPIKIRINYMIREYPTMMIDVVRTGFYSLIN